MVTMMTCDTQGTFTFILACAHIFLALLIDDLCQNHVLPTLSLCVPLFWVVPTDFDLLPVTPRTRR